MKLIQTDIPDVVILEPQVYSDDRGFFMETWSQREFERLGIKHEFVQDNHSCSNKGVLRGLHFQTAPYSQGKLVRVVKGAVYDVAVDLRNRSKTYGEYVSVKLSAENKKMLWIPEGFAHGFLALEDETHFLYKTTNFYNKESEKALRWDDADLNIDWPEMDAYLISEKDKKALAFSDINFD